MLRGGDTTLRGRNVTGTQCYEEGTQCYGDTVLRGGDTTLQGHYVTGTYLYGLGTNRNNEGTLCNTLGTKCNGDMNGDTKITGRGHSVTGVGTLCYGGHNERGQNVTRSAFTPLTSSPCATRLGFHSSFSYFLTWTGDIRPSRTLGMYVLQR